MWNIHIYDCGTYVMRMWSVCAARVKTYVNRMWNICGNICETHVAHLRILGLDCVVFMFYLCIRLRICAFYVGGKIRPYFVQITQNKALFWNARKTKINRNINKTQTRTQTFVHVCDLCFFMLGKKTYFGQIRPYFVSYVKKSKQKHKANS